MKTQEAAQELNRIAQAIENTGHVDTEALITLIASLEGKGKRVASSNGDVASALRSLATNLGAGESRPSRAVLASALRRVFAETMDVGIAKNADDPGAAVNYNLAEGFEFIRNAAITAYRRGSTGHQTRQAFDQLASLVAEIGLMCESIGSTDVPGLAIRMTKAIRLSRRLLKPDMVESLMMVASDKTAASLTVTQMLRSFNEGTKFGDFEVGAVGEAAERLENAAMKAAKLAFQYHLDTPPTNLFSEIAGRLHDLAFYMGAASVEPALEAQESARAFNEVASDKTAAPLVVTQMVQAFREGAEFGDYQMRDVRGAALRLSEAAKDAAKYTLRANTSGRPPVSMFQEIADRAYDLAFYMGSATTALAKTARFEEGKPVDPTENMSEEDAAKWKTEHDNNKDNFKAAAFGSSAMRTLQSVATKVKGDGWKAELDEDDTFSSLKLVKGSEHDSPKITAIIHDGDDLATVRMGPKVHEVKAAASEIERAVKKFQGTVKEASDGINAWKA